jgi:hypothetical protein
LQGLPAALPDPRDGAADPARASHSLALFERGAQGVLSPLGQFLLQEIRSLNALVAELRATLEDQLRGLQGDEAMSRERLEMLEELVSNRVPAAWRAKSFPGMGSLRKFLGCLRAKTAFVAEQIKQRRPAVHWLPGYFHPGRLVCALLQEHARATSVCIEELELAFDVLCSTADTAAAGAEADADAVPVTILRGLAAEGARWSAASGIVEELSSSDGAWSRFPDVAVRVERRGAGVTSASRPLAQTAGGASKPEMYALPVYDCECRSRTSDWGPAASKPVLFVSLPVSAGSSEVWLQRNVALFCDYDEMRL